MGARTRSRFTSKYHRGSYTTFQNGVLSGTSYGGGPGNSGYESTSDTTGPRPYVPHSLSKYKRESEPLRLSGKAETPTGAKPKWEIYYNGYNPSNRSEYSYAPTPVTVDWDYWRTKALANINPNKPDVDLPVFLFELKEIPKMLHQLGRILSTASVSNFRGKGGITPTDVSSAYLAYSFGWAPLIGDLRKLIDFGQLFDDRLQSLREQSWPGGKKFNRTLGSKTSLTSSGSYELPAPTGMSKPLLTATFKSTQSQKAWFSARVELQDALPELGDSPNWTAAKAVLGLNISAATIWEALPFSWLVDYFANVGDFLEAQRGGLSFRATDMCVMVKTEQLNRLDNLVPHPGVTAEGGTLKCIQKERRVYALPRPALTTVPIFTGHMAGILGSLATTKLLRSAGAK